MLAQQTKVDLALEEVEALQNRIDNRLDTAWKLQMLRQDWQVRKQDALQFEPERAQVAFDLDSRWLNEVTNLMQHAGYASNLAMDSDFDISYLVDSVLRKMPGLVDTLGAAQGFSILLEENISSENRNHLLQVIGLVRSTMGQVDHNSQMVFRHNHNMGFLAQAINGTLDSLQKMYEEVRLSHAQLEVWNQELEQKIAERTAALRNLLDHAGQGFLSFNKDLRISREYSAECTAIFQCDIAGQAISSLFYPEEGDQQAFLEAVLRKIFQEENEFLRETYFSLLPEEVVLGNCYIGIAYKMIQNTIDPNEGKIMLILTDRTLQKEMENQVKDEKDTLAMIVHVVTHSEDFFATVNHYKEFCREGLPSLLQEKKSAKDAMTLVFRIVHTFKGTFGQLRMKHIMAKLHELEGWLENIRYAG
ncbi:hypothetical protein SOV_28140 [Sporomusa ovata DSM 2662]|uniref:Signal transduction histidine kinase CheA n=1 Tax=Sporomusa ovata TaxID=2378 RepID=A0A0U1L4V3_9FIRM|nr:Hpt domain-containing protein [Sporomusa ovata]EQB26124.1 histidine kinase-like chemotaxis protein [Sporomusa ovata DSM 2662]CQR74700.1 Signal transduction histidine kinase CheA [Sporomusa ovata]